MRWGKTKAMIWQFIFFECSAFPVRSGIRGTCPCLLSSRKLVHFTLLKTTRRLRSAFWLADMTQLLEWWWCHDVSWCRHPGVGSKKASTPAAHSLPADVDGHDAFDIWVDRSWYWMGFNSIKCCCLVHGEQERNVCMYITYIGCDVDGVLFVDWLQWENDKLREILPFRTSMHSACLPVWRVDLTYTRSFIIQIHVQYYFLHTPH